MSELGDWIVGGLMIFGIALGALVVGWPRRFTTTRPLLFVGMVSATLLVLIALLTPPM